MGYSLTMSRFCWRENRSFPETQFAQDARGRIIHYREPLHFINGDVLDGDGNGRRPMPTPGRAIVMPSVARRRRMPSPVGAKKSTAKKSTAKKSTAKKST